MPSLDFKGKQFVYSHHLSVPFRELKIDKKKSCTPKGQQPSLDDNLIIHGDNLEALKALLPTHAGKVDCIFIDPPYNTGNEGWCYNDNVRSPLMKEWLKKSANPVDKEDLERHDKWLSMMWPRLKILHELLAIDGVLWMTLDDNESFSAKLLCDEIFGDLNFLGCVIWQHSAQPKGYRGKFSVHHNYIFCYKKSDLFVLGDRERTEEDNINYSNPDNDPKGDWRSGDVRNALFRPNLKYRIKTPSGKYIDPPENGWRWSEKTLNTKIKSGEIVFNDDESKIIRKIYLDTVEGRTPETIWFANRFGSTRDAAKQQKQIFGKVKIETSKPTQLIEEIISLSCNDKAIILDSFAGSGSTGHAVLSANKKDEGNRRFILIECEKYANTLTAERVRRVIKGYNFVGKQSEELYSENITWTKFSHKTQSILEKVESIEAFEGADFDKVKKEIKNGVLKVVGEREIEEKAPGIGGSFTYCNLGEPINVESLLTGKEMPSFGALAKYVFYTVTGQSIEKLPKSKKTGFIGESELFRIHLIYKPDKKWLRSNGAALNADLVEAIAKENVRGKRAVVFAVAKFMSQKELTKRRIEFCQLPYAVHKILGD